MEALISRSFDNLSSHELSTIRKGLRRLEGLLAQLCLPSAKPNEKSDYVPKPKDAKFGEYIALQNGFEWNLSVRLIACLERLLGMKSSEQLNRLLLLCLDLLQGTLLLHPSSRQLFARENHMNTLLDMLDVRIDPGIQSATLLTLVCALLDQPVNTRTFEALDGLFSVTSLFKHRDTTHDVKIKLIEFLYFYLMPEPGSSNKKDKSTKAVSRAPSRSSRAVSETSENTSRSTEEKQKTLGRYLMNVDELVDDLKENQLSFID